MTTVVGCEAAACGPGVSKWQKTSGSRFQRQVWAVLLRAITTRLTYGSYQVPPRPFVTLFDTNLVPMQLVDCIADLLRYEPKARLTTQQCLDHAYFREVAYRYAPYRPPNANTTSSAASINGSIRSVPSVSVTSTSTGVDTPLRQLPPAHSHSPSQSRPAFQVGADGSQRLPSVDAQGYYSNGPTASRHTSETSHVSGISGYPMQVNVPVEDSPMAFPEGVDTRPSPSSSSVWSGPRAEPSWSQVPTEYTGSSRAIPAFGGHQRRPSFSGSVAPSIGGASTFYDGSIFEGFTAGRPESIASYAVNYDSMDAVSTFDQSPPLDAQGQAGSFVPGPSSIRHQQQQSQHAPSVHAAQSSSASVKSGRWSFGKAFSSSTSTGPTSASPPSVEPPKRAPSIAASSIYPASEYSAAGSTAPTDPKAAKAAKKEAEKLKREMQQQAARERARAVMRKKQQLMEAADPLHNVSSIGMGLRQMPAPVDKGKARADRSGLMAANAKMPQIVEDTSRLYVSDPRHKARRRDVDDDVHSVSSNETGMSAHRGRPFSVSGVSISSVATSASDPERRSQHQYDVQATRAPSHSSILSTASRPHPHVGFRHAPPPSTGHSSIDSQLLANMQGLATSGEPGWMSPASERSESRGARGTSPHHEQRYSPYPFPNGANTSAGRGAASHLPPISTFDPAQYRNPIKSSAASIASFHSTPGVLPSYTGARGPSMDVDMPAHQPTLGARTSALDGAALPSGPSPTFPYKTSEG